MAPACALIDASVPLLGASLPLRSLWPLPFLAAQGAAVHAACLRSRGSMWGSRGSVGFCSAAHLAMAQVEMSDDPEYVRKPESEAQRLAALHCLLQTVGMPLGFYKLAREGLLCVLESCSREEYEQVGAAHRGREAPWQTENCVGRPGPRPVSAALHDAQWHCSDLRGSSWRACGDIGR